VADVAAISGVFWGAGAEAAQRARLVGPLTRLELTFERRPRASLTGH
jgi:hypothetical protein